MALARALVNRPRVLLLDEPLGALDLKLREEMQVELKAIQHDVGITFVFVTHDQDEALSMSDRVAVFNHGRVEQVGTPQEIYERPATAFVAGFVGTVEPAQRRDRSCPSARPRRAVTVRPERIRVVAPDAGRTAESPATVRRRPVPGADVRLRVALDDGGRLVASRAERRARPDDGRQRAVRSRWPGRRRAACRGSPRRSTTCSHRDMGR